MGTLRDKKETQQFDSEETGERKKDAQSKENKIKTVKTSFRLKGFSDMTTITVQMVPLLVFGAFSWVLFCILGQF